MNAMRGGAAPATKEDLRMALRPFARKRDVRASERRLTARLDAMGARMDNMDARMDSLDARMDSLDARMDSLDGRMDSLDAKVASMDSKLDSHSGNLHRLNLAVTRMQGDIVEIKTDVASLLQLKTDFNRFVSSMDQAAERQEALLSRLAVQGDMLMDHERRLTRLESKPS